MTTNRLRVDGGLHSLRVLMISKALVVGAYHAKLKELAGLDVELTAVVPSEWGGQKLEWVRPEGYEILVMRSAFNGTHHFHFFPGISRVIGAKEWDLVHIDEEAFNVVTFHTLRACVKKGRKAVFFTWQNISKTYPPPFNYFESFSYKNAEGAIAGNQGVKEVLVERKFDKPIRVIPQFGVDPDFFRASGPSNLTAKLGVNDKFVVGFVGRFVKEKGVADLIQTLVSMPDHCVLLLVGSGPFEDALRKLSTQLGVASRIRWVPRVSSLEMPEYMNSIDVLVLPSRTTPQWKEQFGRVLIEAMACQTPVVGSNSAEIPNVIGDAGLVFPEGDISELVGCLRALYEDPGLRANLGVKGRERVLERFTHRRIAEQTADFYRIVLEGPETKVFSEAC
jgi:glycosyltransferase involved in cell wall biosynthesis